MEPVLKDTGDILWLVREDGVDWGDQKVSKMGAAFSAPFQAQAEGAWLRPHQQGRGAAKEVQLEGQSPSVERRAVASNATLPDHASPRWGRQTQLREHSYPIHGDIGAVMDSPEGRRQRCGVAAVFRKRCSVQHKTRILVRKICEENTSLFSKR